MEEDLIDNINFYKDIYNNFAEDSDESVCEDEFDDSNENESQINVESDDIMEENDDNLKCCIDHFGTLMIKSKVIDTKEETLCTQNLDINQKLPTIPDKIKEEVDKNGLCTNCPYLYISNNQGARILI